MGSQQTHGDPHAVTDANGRPLHEQVGVVFATEGGNVGKSKMVVSSIFYD